VAKIAPLSSLSGALNPVEAMPDWLQPLTLALVSISVWRFRKQLS
jgi:hypothetical protein